jgi:hypothetical protein
MTVMASAVAAKAHVSEPVRVEDKAFNYYNRFLTGKATQGYRITVKEGQKTTIKINSKEGVSIKLYLPDGTAKIYDNEKFFNFTLHAAGEYVVELNSPFFAQYSLNVFSN